MRTTRDSLSLDEQVCFAMVVATRSVLSIYRPVLEPLGLTHPQYLVMLALWQGPPLSLKDLAGALRLDSATLSPLLKRLETAGYVRADSAGAGSSGVPPSCSVTGVIPAVTGSRSVYSVMMPRHGARAPVTTPSLMRPPR